MSERKRVTIPESLICDILDKVAEVVVAARYETGACLESQTNEEEAEVTEEYTMNLVSDMLDHIEKNYSVELYWEEEE